MSLPPKSIEKDKISRRSAARYGAIQALFHIRFSKENKEQALKDFEQYFLNIDSGEDDTLDLRHADRRFLEMLVDGVLKELDDLVAIIDPYLAQGWSFEKMEPVVGWILLLGVYELLRCQETDTLVIFNEYVEATKAFATEKEASFVNGVLDRISKNVRETV